MSLHGNVASGLALLRRPLLIVRIAALIQECLIHEARFLVAKDARGAAHAAPASPANRIEVLHLRGGCALLGAHYVTRPACARWGFAVLVVGELVQEFAERDPEVLRNGLQVLAQMRGVGALQLFATLFGCDDQRVELFDAGSRREVDRLGHNTTLPCSVVCGTPARYGHGRYRTSRTCCAFPLRECLASSGHQRLPCVLRGAGSFRVSWSARAPCS